ncbi:hypothetical protein P280DRAFT_172105 [Massarina eburnea CBS 473.64]|uniref:Uncharacterized protein n=1 Tax=Massarina eburnea CBS 473.64 TaxID=1395130 RepID=A0A6A6S9Q2_9PLEO|nr:hypothetical protein P280DRAFT_172105 [Massarina eburnea CBS 473.64]
MCQYSFVTYGNCQHAEVTTVSYCDRAKQLGIPQRYHKTQRGAGVNSASGHLSESSSSAHSTNQHHTMSTLLPMAAAPQLSNPNYSNVHIAIPPGTQSTSLSMELSHDATISTLRPGKLDLETPRDSSASTAVATAEALSSPEAAKHSPRKSIPQEWVSPPSLRGAPKLQTELRGIAREKKRADQANTPPKTLRSTRSSVDIAKTTFLTKEKSESLPSSPLSPTSPRIRRTESKPSLKSPVRSPVRSHTTTSSSAHARALSVISTGDTEFHSARHSPMSLSASEYHSPANSLVFHDSEDNFPTLILEDTNDHEQKTDDGSKTKSHQPRLSLKIPRASASNKPPFTLGSASSSASGSPTRTSRIPRINIPAKTTDKPATLSRSQSKKGETKHLSLKLPHEVSLPLTPVAETRHVRTLNSAGITPIITQESLASSDSQPDTHTMVTSYLERVDHGTQSEHTPFTEELASSSDLNRAVAKALITSATTEIPESATASRTTSMSTVKAVPSEDSIHKDPAVVSSRKSSIKDEGRGEKCVPKNLKQTQGQQSIRPQTSDLRPTARDFIPADQMPAPASSQMPFNPLALDMFGIPWVYHMYPVPLVQPNGGFIKTPKKFKTIPRGRKRGNSTPSSSPKKVLDQLEKFASEADTDPSARSSIPFAAQLEEVDRSAEARNAVVENKELPATATPVAACTSQAIPVGGPIGSGAQTLPFRGPGNNRPHNRGNGLFDYDRTHGRPQVGIPIDQSAPFPNPIPPTGRKQYSGYYFENVKQAGCENIEIVGAAEWGGRSCNRCEPDH